MALYKLSGLTVSSDVAFALPAHEETSWAPDIILHSIEESPTGTRLEIIKEADGIIAGCEPDGTYRLDFYGQLSFRVSGDGSEIAVAGASTVPPDPLTECFTQFVLPLILALKGHAVLHASAVCNKDRCIVFLAPSSHGKSTLAAFFVGCGYRLVTDDVLPVKVSDSRVLTYASCAGAKLREDSIQYFQTRGCRLGISSPNRYVQIDSAVSGTAAIEVTSVVSITKSESKTQSHISALSKIDATKSVIRDLYRPQFMSRSLLLSQTEIVKELCRVTKVLRLAYKHDFKELERIYDMIQAL